MYTYKNNDDQLVVIENIDCIYVDFKTLEAFEEQYQAIKDLIGDKYLSVTVALQGGGSYDDCQLAFNGIRLATKREAKEYYEREEKCKEIDRAAKLKQYERLKKELNF